MPEGFKKTEYGVIPKDWKYTTWEKVGDGFTSGATPYRAIKRYYNGNIKWVSSGELNYNTIYETIEHISLEAKQKTNLKLHPENTFLMAITGLEAAGTRGSCALLGVSATTNQSCMAVYETDKLDTRYLFYYYCKNGNDLAFKYCQGTKQQSFTAKIVKQLPIVLPEINEQKSIANVLSDVDGMISSLEKLIAKKKAVKQGAMQELLTGKKRLPGFINEWKYCELGCFVECVRGVSYKGNLDLFSSENNKTIRLLRSNNIQEAKFNSNDVQYIARDIVRANQILNKFDIMICMANGSKSLVGKNCIFNDNLNKKYTFGAFMSCLRAIKPEINMHYIFYLLNSTQYWDNIALLLSGSSINNLRPSDILEMKFYFPTIAEQKAIASILSDMDNEIEVLEQKLAKTRQLKQGMMQQLLTGKIRLI